MCDLARKTGESGETPLIPAAYFEHKAVVAALIKAGADQTVKDDHGCTARDYAEDNKHGWDDAIWQPLAAK